MLTQIHISECVILCNDCGSKENYEIIVFTDDLDMEIMINSPPAISVESLALAHLRDSFMKESRKIKKNAHSSSPVHRSSNEMQGKRCLLPPVLK